ncbi:hypothetical protein COLO4_15172 [Corchorus olitorius]|uniref:Uncharacterized protein n=1 Tax=Corchorus olitorius TaxID=93759 RepID=A0A1R3JP34_9ROSI|nr:hypothetical protein COLO4_15172 [Corchorus olitorius]
MGKREVAAEQNGEENLCFFRFRLCVSREKKISEGSRGTLCGKVGEFFSVREGSGEGVSCVQINMYQIEIRMQSWPTTNLVNRILSPILSILPVLTCSSILVLSGD